MRHDAYPEYLWKDIGYDTADQIAGKVYPRTVFYLHWLRFYFHVIEMENGEFFCGYTSYPEPYRAVYKCSKAFVESLVLFLFQISIPVEIQKYSNDIDFCNSPHSLADFWSIECHWDNLHLRFIDDANHFTYDFAVSAMRIMEKLTDWINQEMHIHPLPAKKSLGKALKGLLNRYFK